MKETSYLAVEDLVVYRKLCQLHLEVCDLTHEWPTEERYELGSQCRRSSNSSPAQLAEKNDDRHVRSKIEGVNRSRGEAEETIHHLYMAMLKKYILEKTLERKIPVGDRRWTPAEDHEPYGLGNAQCPPGWPDT